MAALRGTHCPSSLRRTSALLPLTSLARDGGQNPASTSLSDSLARLNEANQKPPYDSRRHVTGGKARVRCQQAAGCR